MKPGMTPEQVACFEHNLEMAIEFHRENPNDPHGVGQAVLVALQEVRDAFGKAMMLEKHPRPVFKR